MSSRSNPTGQLSAWEQHYALVTRPFALTPDLRFAYHSHSHSRALAQVTEALRRREGLIVVTGEIGTGKTMLCRTLLETFEARTFLSVILDPGLSVDDLLRQVLTDFGLLERPSPGTAPQGVVTRHQLVTALQQFLASLISLGAHAVIMIDEAQRLNTGVLEELRLLSNFETDEAKLLQIVLVGQPELDDLLQRPDMRQLTQRIARRWTLHPLLEAEVQAYVEHRLSVAAQDGAAAADAATTPRRPAVEFAPEAIRAVAAVSQGIPRVINTICNGALEAGFERQTRTIDGRDVHTAAERLKIASPTQAVASLAVDEVPIAGGFWQQPAPADVEPETPPESKRRLVPAVAAAALVLVAAALAWRVVSSKPQDGTSGPANVQSATPPSASPPKPPEPRAETAPPPTAPPALPAATEPAPDTPSPQSAAPASSLPPANPPPPEASSSGYVVVVASFRTARRASAVVAEIKDKGLPASIRVDGTSGWNVIVVGPYPSDKDAAAAQGTLARGGFPDARIAPAASTTPSAPATAPDAARPQ